MPIKEIVLRDAPKIEEVELGVEDEAPVPVLPQPQYRTTPEDIREPVRPWVQPQIGAAPEPTFVERARGFFVGEPKYGRWTKPTKLDYLHRTLGLPLNIITKFASGRTFGADKLAWYTLSKIRPDLADRPLEEQIAELDPYERSGFQKMSGEVAEFIGEIQSATKLLRAIGFKSPKGKKLIDRISAKVPPWMASGAISELVEGITYEKRAGKIAEEVVKQSVIRGAEAIVWSGVEWGTSKVVKAIARKYPDFARAVAGAFRRAKTTPEKAQVRKDAEAARAAFRKTGEIPPEYMNKYVRAGIRPEVPVAPPIREFGRYPLARAIVRGRRPPAVPPVAKVPAEPVKVPPKPVVPKVPEIVPEAPATAAQKAQAHIIARKKAFVSIKGKMKPGYKRFAKAMTGKKSMKDMTSEEAKRFIDAIKKLPEPTIRKGKLVPPSIPRTTKLATVKQFQRTYKRPTPLRYMTSQTYYAEVLGVKEIVKPLEEAKQRFDLEFSKARVEVDKKIAAIDKFYGTTLKEKIIARLKNQPTKAVAKIRDLLDKYETAPADLSIEETQIFNWFRDLNKEVLRRENEVRAALDMAPIKERKAYVRHVADVMAAEILQGKYPFPEGKAYWAQRIVGKKIFNPMEFQRKIADDIEKIFTKDLAYATKSMLWGGLKEIHLSKPLRFFSEQLGAVSKDVPIYKGLSARERKLLPKVMPAGTKRWLIDYVNQEIKGQETWTDRQVNNLITETGLGGLFNKALKPFGRTISRQPITKMFQKGGRLIISGVMGWRPKQLIRNKFQILQNLALYNIKANVKSFMPASSQLQRIIDESLFIKGYTGFEELPKDLMGKLEKGWLAPYQWTAVSNATQAMKAAYWDTMDLIAKSKYKKYGWADPKRTYKEKPEFLYPSEMKKIKREMDFGAGVTQYQYIPMGMPEVFRHKAFIPMTRLQSWWMNHFAKFHREAAHRFIKGEPMWSADGSVTLPWSRRLGWFRYLVLGGLVLNTMGYTRSFLFGAAPTGLPPAAQFALASYIYLVSFFTGEPEEWQKRDRARAKKSMYNAFLTFIPGYLAYRDYEAIWSGRKDLKSLFFYEKMKKRRVYKKL